MFHFLCQKINKLLEFIEKSSGVCKYMVRRKLMNGMEIQKILNECLWYAFLTEKMCLRTTAGH